MYLPSHFAASEATTRELLAESGAADLVTTTPTGMLATFLPFIFDATTGEYGSLLGHVARDNEQWRAPVLGEALVIVHGLNAYISPSWYASKRAHRRVVPTWDYLMAHVYGRLVIHDDPQWTDDLVRRLTDKHEALQSRPWSVDDAPPAFIAAQLGAIVGIEVVISRMATKAKWSQNRSAADIAGVIDGLAACGRPDAAEAVRAAGLSTSQIRDRLCE